MSDGFNNDSMLELYLFEATALLEGLDSILLEAERARTLGTDEINEIFRIMHTIKGSSAMMAFDTIADVAHRMEDIFAAVRENGLEDSNFDGLFDLVLRASEFLGNEVTKIQEGSALLGGAPELIKGLEDFEGLLRASGAPPGPKPDLGRMLGAPPTDERRPAPAPLRAPEPVAMRPVISDRPPLAPGPADMPVAPEGGRMLGVEPAAAPNARAARPPVPEPRLRQATDYAPGGGNTVYLHVYFNEGARMENIRAFMLANKLSEFGKVNRTLPSDLEDNSEAADSIIENGFYVSFTSNMFREQIEAVAKGTLSVESVSFVRKMPDDDGPAAAPGPAPSPETPARETGLAPATPPAPEPAASPTQWILLEPGIQTPVYSTPEAPSGARPPDAAPTIFATPEAFPQADSAPPRAALDTSASVHLPAPVKQNIISVDLKKLDSLMDLVGEIVINESMVTENPDLSGLNGPQLENFNKAARRLNKLTDALQDSVMSVRMAPIRSTFQRMRRGVRDMGKRLGKNVELVLAGENTEVDKTVLDAIGDPVMHLVRNAVDHAIETPGEREAAGKSPTGHVTLSAQNVGGEVIISVSDDGGGLDRERILAKAESKGLLKKAASEYTDIEIDNLLTAPGFSTKDDISEYSGRGVGLDVVKMNVERLGGTVIIESVRGVGTNVLMKIPLTLAIIDCMAVRVGEEIYAIPIGNIRESFKPSAGRFIVDPNGNEMMMLRGTVYPIVRLYGKLGIGGAVKNLDEGILILADSTDHRGCLLADEIIGKFQVVVKGIPAYLKEYGVKSAGVSGCTIMGNGDVSLILDVKELLS
ncbi:MAG: chemotaxis protein CheA [Clostridiales Family XIII bacterium]|jgi:two-component system chemotaxis sensor kinase CheA|nr:chemotaxis protein CheA [Clostridiales Family XIII bacterium]